MATMILRPVADISLSHSCSSGSNGYSLINEEVSDGDSTYIYQKCTSTISGSVTSKFKISGNVSKKIKISSISLYAMCLYVSNFNVSLSLTINGITNDSSRSAAVSYNDGDYSRVIFKELTSSELNISDIVFDNFDQANIILEFTTKCKSSSKSSSVEARVTQIYAEVKYEEISGTGLYIKSNGSYSEAQKVYKKVNGVYVEQTDISSLFSTSNKYVKGS